MYNVLYVHAYLDFELLKDNTNYKTQMLMTVGMNIQVDKGMTGKWNDSIKLF